MMVISDVYVKSKCLLVFNFFFSVLVFLWLSWFSWGVHQENWSSCNLRLLVDLHHHGKKKVIILSMKASCNNPAFFSKAPQSHKLGLWANSVVPVLMTGSFPNLSSFKRKLKEKNKNIQKLLSSITWHVGLCILSVSVVKWLVHVFLMSLVWRSILDQCAHHMTPVGAEEWNSAIL